ncbi:MAG: acyltransferase [Acutalibacteraceae bacterium]|nr:acyltransferase [Acutalibacteraceae bacterium]
MSGSNTRKYYIDNIRWFTVLLVIVYHVIYMFNSVGVISNIDVKGIKEMDYAEYFVYPWFMCLLFVVAGMSAKYSLSHRSAKEFAKDRAKRLLVPSIAGIFILGWIGGWVTNQYIAMFDNDATPVFIKYLVYCICGIGPLWFAHQLFLASMVLLLIRAIDKKDRLWHLCGKANIIVILLLVFAVWISSMILNTPLIEVYRNGIYIFMFLLGYYLFSHEEITDKLVKFKIPLLIVAAITGITYSIYYFGENYSSQECLQSFFTNAYAWIMILAIIGCFKAWCNKENKFTNYMTKANFGFYILHYPLMVMLAYLITTYLQLPMILNYILILVAEIILLPLFYEFIRRIPVLKFLLLGISSNKKKTKKTKTK